MTEQGPAGASHVPVMLDRVVGLLAPGLEGGTSAARRDGASDDGASAARRDGASNENRVVVDATLGLGGHAEAILRRCSTAHLVGLDRDREALARSGERLAPFGDRFTGVHAVYDRIADVLAGLGIARVHGVLLDLGVSSLQLDQAERGFAYAHDAPLDMRMDQSAGMTAADVLNTYDVTDLTRILRRYGEERFASRIAAAVVRERQREPFHTSARLVELVRAAIPAPARRTGGHPAKRTFQALRIEVNGELEALERALPAAISVLAVGGRMVVLSYHSLEDRLVKKVFAAGASSTAPLGLPVELPEHRPVLKVLTRPEPPTEDEVAANPRAASARLRAVERIREAA